MTKSLEGMGKAFSTIPSVTGLDDFSSKLSAPAMPTFNVDIPGSLKEAMNGFDEPPKLLRDIVAEIERQK